MHHSDEVCHIKPAVLVFIYIYFFFFERLKCDSNQCLLILVVNLSVFTMAAV